MINKQKDTMKVIEYNNKTYKIPEPFSNNIDMEQALDMCTCTNPYSNQSCELPNFASTIYYNIKDAEWAKEYKVMQKGLDWFSRNFTDQYYTLLD